MTRSRPWSERGALLGLVVLVAYVWLAPAHIVAGDNAEFATLGALGGRAHPSGYPLYVLWLRAWSWLPLAPAHAANVATALLAAVQVIVLHAACRAWGARASAATVTAALFAAAPLVLRVHTEADVFALNSLVASAILLVAAPAGPLRGRRRAAVLGLVAGLGLANNLTCGLLAPIGIWGVVRGAREARTWAVPIALATGAFIVGLLPYAYLFVAPDAASWGPVGSLGDLADTVLRKDYGYAAHVASGGAAIPIATSLAWHGLLLARTWLYVPLLGGIAALALHCRRGPERVAWWMLAASWIICGPLFATRLGMEPRGVSGYIGARMQILSAVVIAVPVALAFEWIAGRVREISARAATAAAIVVFVALTAAALPRLARVHGRAVEAGIANMLVAMPPAAIAVVVSEDQCFGARYLQLAEGMRPDVSVVCWALATRGWYRDRLAAQGVPLLDTRGGPATLDQAARLLDTKRPLIVDGAQPVLLAGLPHYPVGVLHRVLPRGARLPALGEVLDRQRALFEVFDLDYPRPAADDDLAAVAHRRYAGAWQDLARALDAAGDHAGAAAAIDVAKQLAPDSR